MFHRLRGLESLDRKINPQPLSDEQMQAIGHVSKWGIGPNNVTQVDLSNKVCQRSSLIDMHVGYMCLCSLN